MNYNMDHAIRQLYLALKGKRGREWYLEEQTEYSILLKRDDIEYSNFIVVWFNPLASSEYSEGYRWHGFSR